VGVFVAPFLQEKKGKMAMPEVSKAVSVRNFLRCMW